jgi:hypothetical protein
VSDRRRVVLGESHVEYACKGTAKFSPFPEAIGNPILTHGYDVKLDAGVKYTISLDGDPDSFNPSLTVFRAGSVVAQSVKGSSGARTMSVTR